MSTSSAPSSPGELDAERLATSSRSRPRVRDEDPVAVGHDHRAAVVVVLVLDVADDISTMSSIETSPSVPPYSSITRAICVRVACILASRSIAGIEGGTNSMLRRILAADERPRQVDLAELEPAGPFRAARRPGASAARREVAEEVA